MARAEKLRQAMRDNPAGDFRIEDVAVVCQAHGLECVAPRRGSHHRIAHHALPTILTIPARRPIKPVYIRALMTYVDDVERRTAHG